MRRPPEFWERPAGLTSGLLSPLGAAWDAAGRLRRALVRAYCAPIPVVCVGNLVTGGAGKTPVVIAVGAALARHRVQVHVVTRGYRGMLSGPVRVDRARHGVASVGDEALLIAQQIPCWVARDRADGIRAAAAAGADTILLDDGFQNPTFVATLSLLVVDAAYGFGNGRVIPAGPLRENLGRGLARADAVVLIRGGGEPSGDTGVSGFGQTPVVPAMVVPVRGERFAGKRISAFAGIGRPEKFFATLRGLGAELIETRAFPDHYPFQAREIAALRWVARRNRSQLVTTAKDFVRVPAAERDDIEVLDIVICWPEPERLTALLVPIVPAAHGAYDRATAR